MVNAITSNGIQAGIYTSASGWYPVVGRDWTGVSDLPLFWTTGKKKDFSEFKPFGGWVRPTIHQYALDVREYMKGCEVPLVDKDWKPCDPVNVLGGAAAKPEDPLHKCNKGWAQLNVTGNCDAVTDEFASWSEGHAHCQRLGAELVSIHSDVETRALSGNIPIWVGGGRGDGGIDFVCTCFGSIQKLRQRDKQEPITVESSYW